VISEHKDEHLDGREAHVFDALKSGSQQQADFSKTNFPALIAGRA
jgi:hypothetical protein